MGPRLEIDPGEDRAANVTLGSVGWRIGASDRITVLAKCTVQLSAFGMGALLPAEPLERETAEVAPVLPHAQLTLAGHAFAPRGSTRGMVQARVALHRGATPLLDKTVLVYGDRATPGELPRHFQAMPLVHERAPTGPWNPVGRNLARGDAPPNLVPSSPSHPIACFARIPAAWPARATLLAAGGVRALGTPEVTFGLFDFRHFLDAPFDQWLPPLEGDETLVLEGLSPHLAQMSTDLPGLAARASWWHAEGARGTVAMRLDCISVDVDRGVAGLVWRGHFGLPLGAASTDVTIRVSFGATPPSLAMIAATPREPELEDVTARMKPLDPAMFEEGELETTMAVDEHELARNVATPFGLAQPRTEGSSAPPRETLAELRASTVSVATPVTGLDQTLPLGAVGLARTTTSTMPAIGGSPPMPARVGAKISASIPEPAPIAPALESFSSAGPSPAPIAPPALVPTASSPPPEVPPRTPPPPAPASILPPAPIPAPSAPGRPSGAPPAAAPEVEARGGLVADLLAGRLSGDTLRATSFAGADLRGADLAGRDLRGCDLRGALFASAKLRGSRLDDAKLAGASFVGADLESASLEGSALAGADLSGANLRSARLVRADLKGATLQGATLDGAILEGADLSLAHAEGASLERAVLKRAALTGAHLPRANLRGANLESANVEGADLQEADLTKSRAERIRANGAKLGRARLDDAEWAHAQLDGADLKGAFLVRASVTHASLARADLSSCDLREASFRASNLRGAICEGTTFDRTDLRGVDLSGATVDEKGLAKARTAGMKRG